MSAMVTAGLYAIFGTGLALVYRVTGVLNFSHGAIASASAYIAVSMLGAGASYWISAIVAVAAAALLAGLIDVVLLRRVSNSAPEAVGILTLGVSIVLIGLFQAWYGGEPRSLRPPFTSSAWFSVGNYGFTAEVATVIVAAIAIAGGTLLLISRTRMGLAVRAVSEGSVTASTVGIQPGRVVTFIWMISGATAGVAGLLISSAQVLTPNYMTLFLVATFVTVVLGGFDSVPGVLVGAVAFGLIQSLIATYVTTTLNATFSFVIIVLVLFFLPHGILGRRLQKVNGEPSLPRRRAFGWLSSVRKHNNLSAAHVHPRSSGKHSRLLYAVPPVVVALIIVIAPALTPAQQLLIVTGACYYVAMLGADVTFGYSGQLSLGQAGFMMLGAYVCGIAQYQYHLSLASSLIASLLVCLIVGCIIGWPAARLEGVYLAVTTLALTLAVPELATWATGLTGGSNGMTMAAPRWLTGPDRSIRLVIAVTVVAGLIALVVMFLGRGRAGREWKALATNPTTAAAAGVRVQWRRVGAFGIGACLAGLAGGMLAMVIGFLSPESFTVWDSIYIVVGVVLGGRASVLGSAIGAALVVGIPYVSGGSPSASGLALGIALVVILMIRPSGLSGLVTEPIAALVGRMRTGRTNLVSAGSGTGEQALTGTGQELR